MWRRWWSSGGGLTGLGSIIIVGNGSLVATLSILVYLRRTLCDFAAAINGGGGGIGGGEAGGDGYHNSDSNGDNNDNDKDKDKDSAMSFVKARRLMRLVNVEALKRKLVMEGKEIIRYSKLIQACESMGVARSNKESINDFRLCTFSMFSFL